MVKTPSNLRNFFSNAFLFNCTVFFNCLDLTGTDSGKPTGARCATFTQTLRGVRKPSGSNQARRPFLQGSLASQDWLFHRGGQLTPHPLSCFLTPHPLPAGCSHHSQAPSCKEGTHVQTHLSHELAPPFSFSETPDPGLCSCSV